MSQDKLLINRKLKFNNGDFPKEKYNELVDFARAIEKADHTKILVEKKKL